MLCTTPVKAQERLAEEAIEQGLALRREGRDEEALASFRRAAAVSSTLRAQAYIAMTCASLGQWVEAHATLTRVLDARSDRWVRRHRAQLLEKLAQIEQHIGWLEVRGEIEGAAIDLDGRRLGTLPFPAPVVVAAGTGTLQVSAAGYLTVTRQVTVSARERVRETVALARAPAPLPLEARAATRTLASASPHPTRDATGSGRLTAAWVVGGVGVAALATGLVTSVMQQEHTGYLLANGEVESGRLLRDPSCADCYARQSAQDTLHWLSIGSYIAGGVLLGTSLVLALTGRSARHARRVSGHHLCAPSVRGVACALSF